MNPRCLVADKPFCKSNVPELVGIMAGRPSHIDCQVIANPRSDLQFEWVFNSSSGNTPIHPESSLEPEKRSVVSFTPKVRDTQFTVGI